MRTKEQVSVYTIRQSATYNIREVGKYHDQQNLRTRAKHSCVA